MRYPNVTSFHFATPLALRLTPPTKGWGGDLRKSCTKVKWWLRHTRNTINAIADCTALRMHVYSSAVFAEGSTSLHSNFTWTGSSTSTILGTRKLDTGYPMVKKTRSDTIPERDGQTDVCCSIYSACKPSCAARCKMARKYCRKSQPLSRVYKRFADDRQTTDGFAVAKTQT